jgi:hypothetical protein
MSIHMTHPLAGAFRRGGEAQVYKDQRYLCNGVSPHTRRDGTETGLLLAGECAECGEAFTFKTSNSDAFKPNRRCQAHKMPFIVRKRDTAA